MDLSHLHSILLRLSHERQRYAADQSPLRAVWVAQIERELTAEYAFLGIDPPPDPDLSDDDLLNALSS